MSSGSRNPRTVADPALAARFEHFGAAVRRRRNDLGWSQEKLAELAGCDRQTINRLENSAYASSLHRLWRLADALGVRLEDLLHEATVTLAEQRRAELAGDRWQPSDRPMTDYDRMPARVG